MKIGILNLTRFGDLIQTTPVLAGLKKRLPEAELHLIVKERFRGATELLPGVTRVHTLDSGGLVRELHDPSRSFVERYLCARRAFAPLESERFDVLYNFTHSRLSAVMLSLLQAERRVGFDLDRCGHRRVEDPWLGLLATLVRARNLVQFNLVDVYLAAAGLLGSGERLAVRIPEPARMRALELLPGERPRVAIQLGASQDQKTWPVERWAQVLMRLAALVPGLSVSCVGVASERALSARLAALARGVAIEDCVGETTPVELAAVLERAQLLLTGDTGTMHLAAAVGTRVCAVFVGLSSPEETAPYGEGHFVVRSRIACAPCDHFVRCGAPLCHDDIPSEWLAQLGGTLLRRGSPAELAPLPRADLLRTRFDEWGLLALERVHARTPSSDERLAAAYRLAFLETLPAPFVAPRTARPSGGWDELALETRHALAELERLGTIGVRLTRRLERAALSVETAKRAGARLARIDARVAELGRAHPQVAPLALAQSSDLERLPDGLLGDVARSAREVYEGLALRAGRVRRVLADPSLPGGSRSASRRAHDPTGS